MMPPGLPKMLGMAVVGEKGQVVIPADARKAIGIEPGSRLVVLSAPNGEGLVLVPAESLESLMLQATEHLGLLRSNLKHAEENHE